MTASGALPVRTLPRLVIWVASTSTSHRSGPGNRFRTRRGSEVIFAVTSAVCRSWAAGPTPVLSRAASPAAVVTSTAALTELRRKAQRECSSCAGCGRWPGPGPGRPGRGIPPPRTARRTGSVPPCPGRRTRPWPTPALPRGRAADPDRTGPGRPRSGRVFGVRVHGGPAGSSRAGGSFGPEEARTGAGTAGSPWGPPPTTARRSTAVDAGSQGHQGTEFPQEVVADPPDLGEFLHPV
jgi:hypothetical protein